MKNICVLLYIFLCSGIVSVHAQYKILHDFDDSTGSHPQGSLTLCGDLFFGITTYGGAYGAYGCIFSIDSNGNNYKDKFDFNGANVNAPFGGTLTLSGNILYGLSLFGGAKNLGCIFSIDTSGGGFKDILDFNDTNGAYPNGSLIITGSLLYGMTSGGGANNHGCFFSIYTNGTGFKDLYDFNGVNGSGPTGNLALSGNVLYGMTGGGGANNDGCIFKINMNGSGYRDMFNFNDTNGNEPQSSLTLSGNKLYGTTPMGGISSIGVVFSIDTGGSGYKVLHNFNGTDGSDPSGSLILSGNKLYCMTGQGGANNWGSIFCIDTNGNGFRDLFYFDKTNGGRPSGSLLLSGNLLFGTTSYGGSAFDSGGVIFSLDTDAIASIAKINVTQTLINVYPNPNNGSFTLSLSNVNTACNVEIYNVLGEKVCSETLSQSQSINPINLTMQSNGVYLYRVITQTGELVGEGKLIIE